MADEQKIEREEPQRTSTDEERIRGVADEDNDDFDDEEDSDESDEEDEGIA